MRIARLALSLATLCVLAAGPRALAEDLTYAISAPVTSADPHYQNAKTNFSALNAIFETLTTIDADAKIVPGLASEWKPISDTMWEFKLRDATFQDGAPLTAEDVIYSLNRPATITNSPASYTIYTKQIAKMEAVDDHTLHIETKGPYPLLPLDLAQILIMEKKTTEAVTTEDLNLGKGVIGTGPYSFVSYTPGDSLVLKKYDGYWGDKGAWDNVTIKTISDDSARTSALLSGTVDAIENVPTPDIERIRDDKDLNFASAKSQRFLFLFLDEGPDHPAGVLANDGSQLPENPFRDVRVRQAINLAINRKAIADRVMMGLAYPSNNIVFDGGEGFLPDLENPAYDPEKAKALLKEAGYPDGFQMTLASPNNRMINDEKVAQAIAQMLTRIGIRTQVDAMPFSVIAKRGNTGDFGVSMMSWGTTVEASAPYRAFLACKDPDKGWGQVNWSNYCNPKADALLSEALSTVDTPKRTELLDQMVKTAIETDLAVIPLYFQGSTWAARKGIEIEPRSDERTTPASFVPSK